jgi:protein O-mannosyl-transferase
VSRRASHFSRDSLVWAAALIFPLTLACYLGSLNGGFVWDDDTYLTKAALWSVGGLRQIWTDPYSTKQYYPLLHTAFWVEHRLWGEHVLGYHLVNVLLHAMNALLLVAVLRRINVPGATLAGVLFAVHPVCVESVAWISEQKNTLSLAFYVLAALAYLRFDESRRRTCYIAASSFFAMALLTKSVTATLPAALLVILWMRRGRIAWIRDIWPLVPWIACGAICGLFTSYVELHIIGAQGDAFTLTLLQRCALAGRVIWFYLGKLVWPANLMFMYPHWDVGANAASWTGYLVAAVLVTVLLWFLRSRTRGPLAAWLFFCGSLFPTLGLFNVYFFKFSYVADHFLYLPSIGIIAAAGAGVALLLGQCSAPARGCVWALVAASVATLASRSFAENRNYADGPTLYKAAIEGNPDNWLFHNDLGVLYKGRGDLAGAIAEYEKALQVKPDYADAHANMGGALVMMPGRLDEAKYHLREALRAQPDFAEAHNSLGVAWLKTPGGLQEAVAEFRQAISSKPEFAEAHNNLGNAYAAMPEHWDDAITQYRLALQQNPNYGEIHFNIALVLLHFPGREDEAAQEMEAFLRLHPDNALAKRLLLQIRSGHR